MEDYLPQNITFKNNSFQNWYWLKIEIYLPMRFINTIFGNNVTSLMKVMKHAVRAIVTS